jgi:hypothetical protein
MPNHEKWEVVVRRVMSVLAMAAGLLLVAAPASAFAHNAVQSRLLHALLDGLTLLVVTAPLWSALLWGPARRRLLLALVAVVQVPVAVIAFVPIANPWLHVVSLSGALGLTVLSLWSVHRTPRAAGSSVSAGSVR